MCLCCKYTNNKCNFQMNCQKSSFTKWDTDFWQPHSSLLSVNGCAFLLRSSNRFVNLFLFRFHFCFGLALSPFTTSFLRSGQGENFARPESKFFVPCVQIPSFLLTMQRYNILKPIPNLIGKNCIFKGVFFANFFKKIILTGCAV